MKRLVSSIVHAFEVVCMAAALAALYVGIFVLAAIVPVLPFAFLMWLAWLLFWRAA